MKILSTHTHTHFAHLHCSYTVEVNREEIPHRVGHKWERIVAAENENYLIGPSNSEIVPLIASDNLRCWYCDDIGVLINANDGACIVRGTDENFDHRTPFEVERCERDLNFVIGVDTENDARW